MKRFLYSTAAVLLLSILAAPVHASTLKGRVVDASNNDGIAALTVKAKADRGSGGRESATRTNRDGAFRIPNLSNGRYLLTVSRGNETLYRKVVTVNGDTNKQIRLRRR